MFRKTSGTILCPSCGRLTSAEAAECLVCGRRNPGMWGFAAPLRAIFGSHSFTNVVTVACIALYVVSLLLDPGASFSARGRSEEHTSELQSRRDLVCRLLLEKKKKTNPNAKITTLSFQCFFI